MVRNLPHELHDTQGARMPLLLVPCDPLDRRRPDPHWAPERDAARELGWSTALVDHDAIERGRTDRAVRWLTAHDEPAIYRGWMVNAEMYQEFAAACAEVGVRLRTGGAAYGEAHELPGWVDLFDRLGAETVWSSGGPETLDVLAARLGAGPAIIRDHVKSAKAYWDEATFIPDVADRERLHRVARRFIEIRDEAFTGGLVLRRFERYTSKEVRTWWVGGQCRLVTAHPDTPDALPDAFEPPAGLAAAVGRHPSPFCTVDLALRDDGVWRVIELGDGQVSDRPTSTPAAELLAAIA